MAPTIVSHTKNILYHVLKEIITLIKILTRFYTLQNFVFFGRLIGLLSVQKLTLFI